MSGASIRRILSAVAAAAFLHLLLVMPDLPAELTPAALVALPLELPVILLLLLAVGDGRAGRALRGGLTLVLTSITLLKLADLAMRSALGRPFNPVADLPLIDASVRLVAGAVGPAAAVGLAPGSPADGPHYSARPWREFDVQRLGGHLGRRRANQSSRGRRADAGQFAHRARDRGGGPSV